MKTNLFENIATLLYRIWVLSRTRPTAASKAFDRIKGGKCFDLSTPWFASLLDRIGQPAGKPAAHVAADQSALKKMSSPSSDHHLGVVGFGMQEQAAN